MRLRVTFPYLKYREHYAQIKATPIIWTWSKLQRRLSEARHHERGSITLSTEPSASGCEIISGMAISIQVVAAGQQTRAHAHAWWHLFFVQMGSGTAMLETSSSGVPLNEGDLLLVPGWCEHWFINSGSVDLVLMSVTNLPQQARLSNLLANEPGNKIVDTAGASS